MTISNFPDLASARAIAKTVSDLKPKIAQAQEESVTGRIADIAAARGGDVGPVISLRKSISDAEIYKSGVDLATTRASISQQALSRIEEDLTSFSTEILATLEMDENPRLSVIAQDAASRLATAVSALNTRHGDRSLFTGSAVDGPALAAADDIIEQVGDLLAAAPDIATAEANLTLFFDDPSGGYLGGVYLGDNGESGIAQTGPNDAISYGRRADEAAVRDLIKGLAVLAAHDRAGFASDPTQSRQLLELAAGALLDADDGVTGMRAALGANEARLAEAGAYLDAAATTFTLALNEQTGRDQFEAATAFQSLSNQLEAAYLSSARLASLSFANFIR